MDDTMMDIDVDVNLDVDPIQTDSHHESVNQIIQAQPDGDGDGDAPMPAAYFESLEALRPIPESLNLQGVNDFGPNEPLDYALEHCPARRPRRIRWINDTSVNLEYYDASSAADALLALTHPDAGVALAIPVSSIPTQEPRKAMRYSKKPDVELVIRECNSGDQKERGAKDRSEYYKRNPQAQRERERERERRKEPPPVVLDYGDAEEPTRGSGDEAMDDDSASQNGARRGRNNYGRDRRDRGRGAGRDADRNGRNRDVDRYRPGSQAPHESRFGRLRGRSASPASSEDGRLGFDEDGGRRSQRYRSRSRDRRPRRIRSRSRERDDHHDRNPRRGNNNNGTIDLENSRWEKDRSAFGDSPGGGRWQKNNERNAAFPHKTDMSNHRRTDAHDETFSKGSLLARMTKDGKPVVEQAPSKRSLASRMTRDGEPVSLASRITRDEDNDNDDEPSFGRLSRDEAPSFGRLSRDDGGFDRRRNNNNHNGNYGRPPRNNDESYGRLKDDDSAPQENNFQEGVTSRNDLASRITWTRDRGGNGNGNGNRRGSGQDNGFSIKGSAPQGGGFSIRGAASVD